MRSLKSVQVRPAVQQSTLQMTTERFNRRTLVLCFIAIDCSLMKENYCSFGWVGFLRHRDQIPEQSDYSFRLLTNKNRQKTQNMNKITSFKQIEYVPMAVNTRKTPNYKLTLESYLVGTFSKRCSEVLPSIFFQSMRNSFNWHALYLILSYMEGVAAFKVK